MSLASKTCADDKMSWDEALALYGEQLKFYVDYLVECRCGDSLLAKVDAEVRDRSVPDEFKLRFMVRVLIQHVIRHMRECTQGREEQEAESQGSSCESPSLERLVYFLRDILEYSARDTSLLIGISDAQTQSLLRMTRRRIEMCATPSPRAVESSDRFYFKWKFTDLDIR